MVPNRATAVIAVSVRFGFFCFFVLFFSYGRSGYTAVGSREERDTPPLNPVEFIPVCTFIEVRSPLFLGFRD